jgi:hypothetical protein
MKIERAEILRPTCRKRSLKWRFAIHANQISHGWLVAITAADGTLGCGYASATKHMAASREVQRRAR